jgi:hypothetical protein
MNVRHVNGEDVNWIHLAQYTSQNFCGDDDEPFRRTI